LKAEIIEDARFDVICTEVKYCGNSQNQVERKDYAECQVK